MSNPILLMSLAGISAGFGKSPSRRKLTGAAKDQRHIKRLPASMRDVARQRYDAITAKVKALREAEMAEFYKMFPEAMPFNYRQADKVVAAFIDGRPAAMPGVESDGVRLVVNGRTVAERRSVGDRFMTVCPGQFGTDKNSRFAANSALRILGAGIRVNDVMRGSDANAFIAANAAGAKGGRVVFETGDACFRVQVDKRIRDRAIRAAFGPDARYGVQEELAPAEEYKPTRNPMMQPGPKTRTRKMTKAQREKLRKSLANKSRTALVNPERFAIPGPRK